MRQSGFGDGGGAFQVLQRQRRRDRARVKGGGFGECVLSSEVI